MVWSSETHPEGRKVTLTELRRAFHARTLSCDPVLSLAYFFRDVALFLACNIALWHVDRWFLLIPLWLVNGLVGLGLYQIGHEAAHGSLFWSKRVSWWVGQIAFLPSLHPYGQWSYGHNTLHHNRTVMLGGDPAWHPRSPERYRRMTLFEKGLHRLYWSPFGAGPYYLIKMWFQGLIWNVFDDPAAKRDRLIVLAFALLSTAVLFYFAGRTPDRFDFATAAWVVFKLEVIPFFLLNYLIGITVYLHHIHETIPWERGERDSNDVRLHGTTNYIVPGFINFFIHNIFIHVPHHVLPWIPFYRLEAALDELKAAVPEGVFESSHPVREYLRQTRVCKLFDPELGEWVGYRDLEKAKGNW